ncbi:MAG: 3'-5' exonuclease [Deltaproteobacteria bacterium]|nr:3'-5' exonuclease [Deltaproteobacteria bacterium]
MKQIDTCGCFPTGKHYPGIAHLIRVGAVGVATELDPDSRWVDHPIAFVDTETTGTDAQVDRVIEVGIVIGRGGEVEARHSWLINPGIPIPDESRKVHGISDDDVAGKPSFGEVAGAIVAAFRGALPAAYNADFDRGFILAELERAGYQDEDPPPATRSEVVWLDPLVWARELFKGKGESRALGAVTKRLGISLERAHRATDDAEAALKVLYALADDSRVPRGYAALMQEQRRLARIQLEAQRFWRK